MLVHMWEGSDLAATGDRGGLDLVITKVIMHAVYTVMSSAWAYNLEGAEVQQTVVPNARLPCWSWPEYVDHTITVCCPRIQSYMTVVLCVSGTLATAEGLLWTLWMKHFPNNYKLVGQM